MNKSEFLRALQDRIHILTEAEQQDILAEYAQHIDLRTAAGLTEEEAIRDFGDLDQLTAEILEAYHVDSSHLEDSPSVPTKIFSTLGQRCRRIGEDCSSLGRRICAWFRGLKERVLRLFRHETHLSPTEAPRPHRILSRCRSLLHLFTRFLRWGVRWGWNLLLFGIGIPLALLAVGLILLLGTVAVLLFQGYPLFGVLLCTLGGILVSASLVCLGWTLRCPRRRTLSVPALPRETPDLSTESEEPHHA